MKNSVPAFEARVTSKAGSRASALIYEAVFALVLLLPAPIEVTLGDDGFLT